ncbi:MAG TPA: beta-ketoacyl-ACP synthase III [Armatimonadota bacterium]|nr:beta-ketoacyl-ACP synthase III [Armatimonadota bacterium]
MESSTKSASRSLREPSSNGASPRFLRPAGILGLGSYAPERVLTNQDLERMVETNDEWIVSRTGIRERRIADPAEKTSDLAIRAASRALKDAELSPEELDLIIVATTTADALFPATASVVQAALGATRAAAFDLSAACSGFIYGLSVGAQFIGTGAYQRVLVIGAETLSRITNWRDRSTCVLFGDGAGAAVLGPVQQGQGFLAFDLGSDGGGAELLAVDPGGYGHPLTTGSEAELACSIRMAGQEVFKFAVRICEESTRRSLERAGLAPEDVDCLIPHQANIRIIDAAAKRLGIEESRVFSNVHRYGNTSAASIPLALNEAREQGRIRPGDTLALVGFGAGLSWASCVLNWTGKAG